MRFSSGKGRLARRTIGAAAVTVVAVVVALTGAAKIGLAGTNGELSATVTVLNEDPGLVLGTPTPGKNIGYDLYIANGSTNTLNHLAFTDSIGNKGKVVYLTFDPAVSCSGFGTDTVSCTSNQFTAGTNAHVIVVFQTDANGSGSIVNTLKGTYAPASQNTTNHRTDPTKSFNIATERFYADTLNSSFAQSLALKGDSLSAGGPGQSSSIQLPPGFVNFKAYVGTTLQNLSGIGATVPPLSVCASCLRFETKVSMPLAANYGTAGPFLNEALEGTPYTFTVRIPGGLLTNGFKPSGVWHKDGAGNIVQLAACELDSNNDPIPLTTDPGICIASLTQLKPSKDVLATVLGFSNGSYWIG